MRRGRSAGVKDQRLFLLGLLVEFVERLRVCGHTVGHHGRKGCSQRLGTLEYEHGGGSGYTRRPTIDDASLRGEALSASATDTFRAGPRSQRSREPPP